ncbi:MAG: tRNA-dihydrouridine synthase family protein [Desulfobulbaceae bacterium]|nr:tRNA-dihydrouridine synthase family protein [Desulfobulbaceae bacterium]
MAPLKGITDALFRRVYAAHFSGLDGAVAPFINPQSTAVFADKVLADLQPEANTSLPVTPQLLNTDATGFLALGNRLFELGYRDINWNLGCPVRMVAKKRRGSGLLPYPDAIVALLEAVLPELKPCLSIKMRLGYHDARESLALLPRLDPFPLTGITIHARLGSQLYSGQTDPDAFARCCYLTRHRLTYNGDITSRQVFHELAGRFPAVERWMIGRGLLANPFLPAEIKGEVASGPARLVSLAAFHDELFLALKDRLSGPGHLLGRLKQIWIYFIDAFPGAHRHLKKITRATSEHAYHEAVQAIVGTAE